MSTFITWLNGHIAQWWQFMSITLVPGTQFSFATLTLFVVAFDLMTMFIGLALHYRTHRERDKK